MAMTGKHGPTSAPVPVTAVVEEGISKRIPDGSYDSGQDVVFHCCSDGLVVDVPVVGGPKSRFTLYFNAVLLSHVNPFFQDMKVTYDGFPSTADEGEKCAHAIMESA